jgi:hypothetical protein
MDYKGVELYTVNKNVECLECGCKAAVQDYGTYHENGLGDEAIDSMGEIGKSIYEKYRNNPYMSHAMGFGGTIPHKCLNCNNTGLIDFGGLEGYKMAFKTIKKGE